MGKRVAVEGWPAESLVCSALMPFFEATGARFCFEDSGEGPASLVPHGHFGSVAGPAGLWPCRSASEQADSRSSSTTPEDTVCRKVFYGLQIFDVASLRGTWKLCLTVWASSELWSLAHRWAQA